MRLADEQEQRIWELHRAFRYIALRRSVKVPETGAWVDISANGYTAGCTFSRTMFDNVPAMTSDEEIGERIFGIKP